MGEFRIAPTLFDGRPPKGSRTPREEACYDLLDSLGIAYERADHDPADTIDCCVLVEKVIGVNICKNLFLTNRSGKKLFLLMMPGRKPFKTKYLSGQIGCGRCSFGTPALMEEVLGVTPGSVSILGLQNDSGHRVQLLIDREIAESEFVRCHPCRNTSTLKLRTEDVLQKLLPAMGHEPWIVELPWDIGEDEPEDAGQNVNLK